MWGHRTHSWVCLAAYFRIEWEHWLHPFLVRSVCGSGCPQTCCVPEGGLKLLILLRLSISQVTHCPRSCDVVFVLGPVLGVAPRDKSDKSAAFRLGFRDQRIP